MPMTKQCQHCGQGFEKPYTCGLPEWERRKFCSRACKHASQQGKPTWIKGKKFPSKARKLLCRICEQPTRYNFAQHHKAEGKVHCSSPACIEASRTIKNARIAQKAKEMYADGSRAPARHAWEKVPLISAEEQSLAPWFLSLGWEQQYRVKTGVHTNKLPRMFRLDFALPEHKLYVEIDGHVHRLRRDSDTRRDAMLAALGWQGLRIPAKDVRTALEAIQQTITSWIAHHYVSTTTKF